MARNSFYEGTVAEAALIANASEDNDLTPWKSQLESLLKRMLNKLQDENPTDKSSEEDLGERTINYGTGSDPSSRGSYIPKEKPVKKEKPDPKSKTFKDEMENDDSDNMELEEISSVSGGANVGYSSEQEILKRKNKK